MRRHGLTLAALLGFTAVALGAFGAHALGDAEPAAGWWRTAAQYHLGHALAAALAALVPDRAARPATVALALFGLGVLLFCGSLYAMSLGAPPALGMVTPLGGLCFLAGWVALGAAGVRLARDR